MSPESPKLFQDEYPEAYIYALGANKHLSAWQKAIAAVEQLGSDRSPNTNITLTLVRKYNEEARIEQALYEQSFRLAVKHMPDISDE